MKKAGLLLVVLSIFCASLTAHAQPAQTWKTGQTVSYATGDDGDLERGVSWPTPRFEDNGDGTVTDYLTGLVWLKNANCAGAMTWNDALTYCNNLASGTCGLTDGSAAGEWRLPNRKELLSLVDYSRYNPALPQGHLFDNVQSGSYWSATTYAGYMNNAWLVYMGYGHDVYYYKLFNGYVWPVCAGQGGSFDELAVDFKTLGIYVYNSGSWNRIYQGVDPERLCSFGTYLAADFGTTYGLYVYDAGVWTRVYKGVAIEKMAGFGDQLAVDSDGPACEDLAACLSHHQAYWVLPAPSEEPAVHRICAAPSSRQDQSPQQPVALSHTGCRPRAYMPRSDARTSMLARPV